MDSVANYLTRIELFNGISAESKFLLASVCRIREFKKKETLFHEGEPGRAVYYLAGGDVQLHKNTPDGKEIVIKIVKPEELFAEAILFEKDNYPVTAVALSAATALLIPKLEFYTLLDKPDFRNDFIAVLMQKLRYLGERIQLISAHTLEERLIIFLQEHFGKKERIFCPLSKKDVAAAIGTTPETLSRLLLRLSESGALTWEGNIINLYQHSFPS